MSVGPEISGVSATTRPLFTRIHLPLSAVFFEMDRDAPTGNPVTKRQVRHLTVSLPLLVVSVDGWKTGVLTNLVYRILLPCGKIRNILKQGETQGAYRVK